MSKQDQVDEDVAQVAQAIAALRKRYGLTQAQVAEAHENDISKQYYGMHETGAVPGIVKPATQRMLLAAISKAAHLDQPLTLQDLADEMAAPTPSPREERALRMAHAVGSSHTPRPVPSTPPAGARQAVFPTSGGDVIVQLPANMTPEAFAELEAYMAVFLKANAPKT